MNNTFGTKEQISLAIQQIATNYKCNRLTSIYFGGGLIKFSFKSSDIEQHTIGLQKHAAKNMLNSIEQLCGAVSIDCVPETLVFDTNIEFFISVHCRKL